MDKEEALQRFRAYLERRFCGRRTPVDYVSDVRQFQRVCPKPWYEVTVADVDAFVDGMHEAALKPATVKRRVTALKAYFDLVAEEEGLLTQENPARCSARLNRGAN